uniref:Uncharacterized protein n=1 Tax=Otus sunia TaxID=257818 RepID=A0A8C8A9Z4_9STRI
MIVTPSRVAARRQGELPLRSVSLSSVPAGTLTPLKELLRYQGTVQAAAEPADGGESRAGESRAGDPAANDAGPRWWLKRRASEFPAHESPAKIFHRMKSKALRQKQGAGLPAGKAPPSTCSSDQILTPTLNPGELGMYFASPAPVIKIFFLPKFKDFFSYYFPEPFCTQIPEKQTMKALAIDPLLPCLWDPTPPNPITQNIPPSTATEKPLIEAAVAEQLGNDPPKRVASDREHQDSFCVELMDTDDEMSQNTVTSSGNLNSTPLKNGGQLEERGRNGEAKCTELHQGRRELQPSNKKAAHGVQEVLETDPQKPSQCFCRMILSSPRVSIPRKQRLEEGCKVPSDKPDTDQVASEADQEVGELNTLGQLIYSCGLLPHLIKMLIATCWYDGHETNCWPIHLLAAYAKPRRRDLSELWAGDGSKVNLNLYSRW